MLKHNPWLRESLIFLGLFIFLALPSFLIVKDLTEKVTPPSSLTDNGGGSSFVSSLLSYWIPSFTSTSDLPETTININYSTQTSSQGYTLLNTGNVLYSAVDYPLSVAEQKATGVQLLPFVSSAVAIAFNLPEISSVNLTTDALVGIYNGTITSWADPVLKEINPNTKQPLPDIDILVGKRVPGSGMSYIFTKALSRFSPAWNSTYSYSQSPVWPLTTSPDPIETDPDMQEYISNTIGAIGYISLINLNALKNGLSLASLCFGNNITVEGEGVFWDSCSSTVEPSLSSVLTAVSYVDFDNNSLIADVPYHPECTTCWPIVGFSYIATKMDYSSKIQQNSNTSTTASSCPFQVFELATMVQWMMTNNEAVEIALNLMSSTLPAVNYRSLNIRQRLENITCDGYAIPKDPYRDPVTTSGLDWSWISVLIIGATVLGLFTFRMAYLWRKSRHYEPMDEEKDPILRHSPTTNSNTSLTSNTEMSNPNSNPVANVAIDISPSLMTTSLGQEDLRLEEHIGTGSFAEVYKGHWQGQTVAVKRMLINQPDREKVLSDFLKESSLMSTLRHKNIVQFLGCTIKPPHLYIVLEYCAKGSLFDVLKNPQTRLSFKQKRSFAIQAAKGMRYLHSLDPPIIHRDLKTANILVDENWKIKVTDFGLSRMIDTPQQTMTHCGTVEFCAPEVLQKKKYTQKADIYSYGVLVWQIFTRRDLFPQMALMELMNKVVYHDLRPSTNFLSDQPELVAVISACWTPKPEHRPEWDVIIKRLRKIQDPDDKTSSSSKSLVASSSASSNLSTVSDVESVGSSSYDDTSSQGHSGNE